MCVGNRVFGQHDLEGNGGSWNPGASGDGWSGGGGGCGGDCGCGGSCGGGGGCDCKGGGGSCGGKPTGGGGGQPSDGGGGLGGGSGQLPLIPDYDGQIWATNPTAATGGFSGTRPGGGEFPQGGGGGTQPQDPIPQPLPFWIGQGPGRRTREHIWADVIFRGLPICLAYGELMDLIAEESSDYADFVRKIHESIPEAEALARDAPTATDPGFNEVSGANGSDNYRHYASAMYYGTVAAAGQALLDSVEVLFEGADQEAENVGEVYADIAGGAAIATVSLCVSQNTAWYKLMAYDDDAWAKCRHLPGNLWRSLFCKKWG